MKTQLKSVRAFAPASIANLGPGFDILGAALKLPGDEIKVSINTNQEITITKIEGDNGLLSYDPSKNVAGIVITNLLNEIGEKRGIEIELYKGVPASSGLGSSAASSVAALVAANELLGSPKSSVELLQLALLGEKAACGAEHADNIAPCLLGGIVLIRSYKPLDVITINTPLRLFCTIIQPHFELDTMTSRKLIRKELTLTDTVRQCGNIAGLITGLLTADCELIRRSSDDVIAEPVRSQLIPGYNSIKETAVNNGAILCSIAGSGPSVFALSLNENNAKRIGIKLREILNHYNLGSAIFISLINHSGAMILDRK